MIVTLTELKNYLRVDFNDDDTLLNSIIESAEKTVKDILRLDTDGSLTNNPTAKIAVLYACAYLYEHREEANHNELNLTLRAMLFADRKAGF